MSDVNGDDLDMLWNGDFSPSVQAVMDAVKRGLAGQDTRVCECGVAMVYEAAEGENGVRGDATGSNSIGNFYCPACDVALC